MSRRIRSLKQTHPRLLVSDCFEFTDDYVDFVGTRDDDAFCGSACKKEICSVGSNEPDSSNCNITHAPIHFYGVWLGWILQTRHIYALYDPAHIFCRIVLTKLPLVGAYSEHRIPLPRLPNRSHRWNYRPQNNLFHCRNYSSHYHLNHCSKYLENCSCRRKSFHPSLHSSLRSPRSDGCVCDSPLA